MAALSQGYGEQFLLVDPWSGNYFDLEAAKFVKPIGIEHFFDAFSLEKKRPLKIDAASALNIQVNDVSDSLVVNQDKAQRSIRPKDRWKSKGEHVLGFFKKLL